MSRAIFLIGMPGSGKSTFGKELAKEKNLPFFDLDQLIESGENKTIPEIFQAGGEPAFRKLEKKYLKKHIKTNDNYILGTGGGTPAFYKNMERMNKAGITVFLDIPLNEIADRLQKDKQNIRPLFQGADPAELKLLLQQRYSEREKFYRQANVVLRCADFKTLEHI